MTNALSRTRLEGIAIPGLGVKLALEGAGRPIVVDPAAIAAARAQRAKRGAK